MTKYVNCCEKQPRVVFIFLAHTNWKEIVDILRGCAVYTYKLHSLKTMQKNFYCSGYNKTLGKPRD